MKVAINGLGRIGRRLTRILINHSDLELVAINDIMDIQLAAHLLKYDTTYGVFNFEIQVEGAHILIGNKKIQYSQSPEIENLPWQNLNIDIIVNCSGTNKNSPSLSKYHVFNPKHVILSSPSESESVPTIIYGFNHEAFKNQIILSNSSCTTYSIVPILDIINSHFEIEYFHFSTIHCYTNDQNLQDAAHQDFRRARNAGQNIVPTSTSATKVIQKLFPNLAHKISASSYRVPVANGSITEMLFTLKNPTDYLAILDLLREVGLQKYKNVITFTDAPIVSSDCIEMPYASVVDLNSISLTEARFLKIVTFYDNEHGYSSMLHLLMQSLK